MIARAPARISFAGGGTDLPQFVDLHGGRVVSATIQRFVYAQLMERQPVASHASDQLAGLYLNAGYRRLSAGAPPRQWHLSLTGNVTQGSGLGGSSAAAVASIAVLSWHLGLALDKCFVARRAWELERVDLGWNGGYQDHYASAHGGFNDMTFGQEGTEVDPIYVPSRSWQALEARSLLVYLPRRHRGAAVTAAQTEAIERDVTNVNATLLAMKALADKARKALEDGDISWLASIVHRGWELKKLTSPLATTQVIDELYRRLLGTGVEGGKIVGAGSGGHLFLICAPGKHHEVARSVRAAGLVPQRVKFDHEGLLLKAAQ